MRPHPQSSCSFTLFKTVRFIAQYVHVQAPIPDPVKKKTYALLLPNVKSCLIKTRQVT